jgi:hypothetical protein
MSDETKQKSISHTRPVVLYSLNGTVYGKYSSNLEAAKSINCGGLASLPACQPVAKGYWQAGRTCCKATTAGP